MVIIGNRLCENNMFKYLFVLGWEFVFIKFILILFNKKRLYLLGLIDLIILLSWFIKFVRLLLGCLYIYLIIIDFFFLLLIWYYVDLIWFILNFIL